MEPRAKIFWRTPETERGLPSLMSKRNPMPWESYYGVRFFTTPGGAPMMPSDNGCAYHPRGSCRGERNSSRVVGCAVYRICGETQRGESPAQRHSDGGPRWVGAVPGICRLLSHDFGSGTSTCQRNHVLDGSGQGDVLRQESRMGTGAPDALRRPLFAGADSGRLSECVVFLLGRCCWNRIRISG